MATFSSNRENDGNSKDLAWVHAYAHAGYADTYPPFVYKPIRKLRVSLRKRSEDPNNKSTKLRLLLFFEQWRNTGDMSDVLPPEDSSLRPSYLRPPLFPVSSLLLFMCSVLHPFYIVSSFQLFFLSRTYFSTVATLIFTLDDELFY